MGRVTPSCRVVKAGGVVPFRPADPRACSNMPSGRAYPYRVHESGREAPLPQRPILPMAFPQAGMRRPGRGLRSGRQLVSGAAGAHPEDQMMGGKRVISVNHTLLLRTMGVWLGLGAAIVLAL